MDEHGAATGVLSYGIDDSVELKNGDGLRIFDRNVNVAHALSLGGYARFAQGNDRRDTVRVGIGEFFGISEAPEPQSFPNSRHSVRSPLRLLRLRGALDSSIPTM